MRILYPLGLIALVAIPLLIIIYIIKNKYTEQVISSTYLWTLSEKFLKRRNPINRLTGILSLILQILAVIVIAFSITHPIFAIKGAANDYCFILDGSASMNITSGGTSRFDKGKSEIKSIINSSANGSTYSLVYVGQTTYAVYNGIDDKSSALSMLSDLSSTDCANGFSSAIEYAQKYFDNNTSIKTYLVTDKSYESLNNVNLINVSSHEQNYAVDGVTYIQNSGKIEVSGKAYSYESSANLTVELYVDDAKTPADRTTVAVSKYVDTSSGADFTLTYGELTFKSLKVVIADSDAFDKDNQSIIYNINNNSTFKTLVVSDTIYIKTALQAIAKIDVNNMDVISTEEFSSDDTYSGYGFYIFDGVVPKTVPSDGAVWFFNPTADVDDSGFSVSETKQLSGAGLLEFNSDDTSTVVQKLLTDTVGSKIHIHSYVPCRTTNASFKTILKYGNDPILLVGSNANKNKEVVFALSLEDSDFPMCADFITLISNLLDYTFPPVLDKTSPYYCGDTLSINVSANYDTIKIISPSGEVSDLDKTSDVVDFQLDEAGTYTITLMSKKAESTAYVYSAIPTTERQTTVTERAFDIEGTATNNKRDGKYDNLLILFIILGVIFIADWAVYCYEQYQLR